MLSELLLRNFRCFESQKLDSARETIILVGDNAQGKTSILEAICVLLRLQSPRTSRREDLVRFGADYLVVEGEISGRQLRVAQNSERRKLAVDGEPISKAGDYLAAGGLVVWMGSADVELVRGSSEERRRYLDFLGCQLFSDYRPALAAYERALRTRNFLLKRDSVPNWTQIKPYNELLQRHGSLLIARRNELAQALEPWVKHAQSHLSGRREEVNLMHLSGLPPEHKGDWEQAWEAAQSGELQRRQTRVGPHRGDIELKLNGRIAGNFGSEGQQRTLALALKLGQARLLEERAGQSPILLLDDIFGELDVGRRRLLLDYLPKAGQKWITTTHLDWAGELMKDASLFRVDADGIATQSPGIS